MAPIQRYNRTDVTLAAYELVRREGPSAVNARSVAQQMGSSTQPIFRLFSGMEELKDDVICYAAEGFYRDLFNYVDASDKPHLAMGMFFLRFAKKESQLFKLLFMRDRISDGCCCNYDEQEKAQYRALYSRLSRSLSITTKQAEELFQRAWLYTYGLAVSIATKYVPCMPEETMLNMISEAWQAAADHLNLKLPA